MLNGDLRKGPKDRRKLHTYIANDRRSGIADRRKNQNNNCSKDGSSKRKDKLSGSKNRQRQIKGHPDIRQLKESAAAELGISVEQLDLMAVDEIEQLAIAKGLI